MLCTSLVRQQAARCRHQASYSLHGRNIQHGPCTVLQPSRPWKLVKVLPAHDASSHCASSSRSSGGNSSSISSSNSTSTSTSSASSSSHFFNRVKELKWLENHCSAPPNTISVIVGPRNTGKTALLREYMGQRGLLDSRCFINARVTPISTPSELATALLNSAIPGLVEQVFPGLSGADLFKALAGLMGGVIEKQKLADSAEFTFNGAVLAPFFRFLAGEVSSALEPPPLAVIFKAYSALLDAWDKAKAAGKLTDDPPPVLVLDEANLLMAWGDQHKVERKTLLDFFVAITKERQCSHVILATSDSSFQTWLSNEIGPAFFQTFVVGDFPAAEAKMFVNQRLQQLGMSGVADAEWETVHDVCGGNAGTLLTAAGAYKDIGDWDEALAQVVKDVWRTMKPGYRPAPDAGYTAADYATAVEAILDSDCKAVHDADLEAVLGAQRLEAMVQANLLALRPYSRWAADINVKAFGPHQRFTVVTAPTPLHLYLMREERDTLTAALQLETSQAPSTSSTDSTAGPSRPPSPTSKAVETVAGEIAGLQQQITGVEDDIKALSVKLSGIMSAKDEGWQAELAVWQQEKQQLVHKAQQLREEKGRLQEEKLVLLKREE